MALFTPRNQIRNMLDAEIGQALCGGPDGNRGNLTKIAALSALMNQGNPNTNWLEDDDDSTNLFY